MYLGLRDIRAAKGRFALISSVVALITLLLVMLTGLTSGLGNQNTSALSALGPDRYVFAGSNSDSGDTEVSFTASSVTPEMQDAWTNAVGAADSAGSVVPLGISQTRIPVDGTTEAVALMGLPAGTGIPGGDGATVPADGVVLPESLGGDVTTGYFSHQPVVWTSTQTWQQMTGSTDPTVLMATADMSDDQFDAVASDTGSAAVTVKDSFAGLPAYQSERGSLLAIQVLLYGISALVVTAFLSVWTIQRTRDIAVLRALGASRRYVVADALGQAAVILLAGVVLGGGVGLVLGLLAVGTVPFAASVATFLLPPVGVVLLGLLGALVAMRRVSTVDPHIALGASA